MIIDSPATYLNDFGSDVVYAGKTYKGILDMPTEVLSGNMVLSTDYQLTYATKDMPDLGYGKQLRVGGVAYSVKSVRQLDDGTFSVADLQKD